MSNEAIKPPATYNNGLAPKLLIDDNDKLYLEFKGSCLKRDKSKFILIETENVYCIPINAVNIYIVYEITRYNPISSYSTLGNCLFGSVKITEFKNPDIDKYKYSGYGIGFDRKRSFSFANGFAQNVIIFGANMSSSVHADSKTKIF